MCCACPREGDGGELDGEVTPSEMDGEGVTEGGEEEEEVRVLWTKAASSIWSGEEEERTLVKAEGMWPKAATRDERCDSAGVGVVGVAGGRTAVVFCGGGVASASVTPSEYRCASCIRCIARGGGIV